MRSSVGDYRAKNVVVATGTYQRPRMSPFSERLTGDVEQMHSSQYRNPERLPPGVVLVVGSGQSGCQIAEELHENGREVYLATGRSGRAPRRYRGADAVWWMARTGFFDRTVDQLPSPADRFGSSLHVSGKDGGRTLNLHRFCRDGIRLLGHLRDGRGTKLAIAPDLQENLAAADKVARVGSAGGDRRRRGSRGSAYRRAPSEPLIYSNTVADPPRAHALFRQSIATHQEQQNALGMTESLLGFAALAIVSDKAVAGTRLLAAAGALGGEKITTAWPATRQEYERYLVLAAGKLTGPAFQSALATGRILSLDEAVLAVQEVVDNVQTSHTLAEQVAELTPRETGREYPCLHGGPSILTLLR